MVRSAGSGFTAESDVWMEAIMSVFMLNIVDRGTALP